MVLCITQQTFVSKQAQTVCEKSEMCGGPRWRKAAGRSLVASERADYCGCAPGGGAACPSAALARLRGGCVIKVSIRSTLDEHAEATSVCSPQALVLELQGLDALPLLLLLRLHLRHEARVDHEACAARARPAVTSVAWSASKAHTRRLETRAGAPAQGTHPQAGPWR